LAARSADVVLVTPAHRADVSRWVAAIRDAESAVGRDGAPLKVLGELVVFLGQSPDAAARRKAVLDEFDGRAFRSDAPTFVGTPEALVDLLLAWRSEGLDGFRLRPVVIGHDLDAIVDIGAGRHAGAAFAVVGGVLLIWAGCSVAHVLTRGGTCALSSDEAVRVVNSGDEPATVVTAWANPAVPAMTTTRSSPCPSSLRR
jgi:hypothetical protein